MVRQVYSLEEFVSVVALAAIQKQKAGKVLSPKTDLNLFPDKAYGKRCAKVTTPFFNIVVPVFKCRVLKRSVAITFIDPWSQEIREVKVSHGRKL